MIERQEIYCHHCGLYVQFDVDTALNGNHILNCPNCKHEHCRVVENGKITDVRWGQRNNNLPSFQVSSSVCTTSSTASSTTYINLGALGACGTGSAIMSGAWLNLTSAG
jgi:uncharacterized protein YbaR (Trm112 family)